MGKFGFRISFSFLLFTIALTACGDLTLAGPSYVGDWQWELTAYAIDGGGAVGRGTVNISSELENGAANGTWSGCEGFCSADSSGEARISRQGLSLSLVLEGSPSTAEPVYQGWMQALAMTPTGTGLYEGIAEFGICTTVTQCYSSSKITLTKISETPTYSSP